MGRRTQITLTVEQYDRLREESARSGLGLAELIRRAVDRSYGSAGASEVLSAVDASFGSWEDRDVDGAAYVETRRRGREHRLRRT